MEKEVLFQCQNLFRTFGATTAVKDVSFDFLRSCQYVIRGASGSGKSTLLYLLGALDRPNQGQLLFEGKDLSSLDDEELASFRNRDWFCFSISFSASFNERPRQYSSYC